MANITTTYIDHMGSDLSVVNAARVSFGKKSQFEGRVGGPNVLSQRDDKLVRYLARHKHLSPFGHAFASFHVKAPVFVARQLVKHKFLRWNEISRRYVDDEPEFYTPEVWRGKADNVKQGSAGEVDLEEWSSLGGDFSGFFGEGTMSDKLWEKRHDDMEVYKLLLDAGVAPEQARMVLPQSTMTEWYWSGSLDAFAAMCHLRCASDTQVESQHVAWAIHYKMAELFPTSWEALMRTAHD